MEEQAKREPPWWRVGDVTVQAWTASEARAAWKRQHGASRCPVGTRAVPLQRYVPRPASMGVRPV